VVSERKYNENEHLWGNQRKTIIMKKNCHKKGSATRKGTAMALVP